MIAEETIRRYIANWGALALAGLFAVLVNVVLGILAALVMMPFLVSMGMSMMSGGGSLPSLIALISGAGLSLLLVIVASILVTPIGMGGLIHGVVQVQRGRAASFGELWQAGLRNWKRLLVLYLICFVVMVVMVIVVLILSLIPVLGPLVGLLAAWMIGLALWGYGSYIAVAEQVSGTEAASRAVRILSAKFGDLLLTMLVLGLAGLAVGLVTGFLAMIPVLGALVPLATQVFLLPLVVLYLANRYERNIAPDLWPPGGQGRFDPGPPPGP